MRAIILLSTLLLRSTYAIIPLIDLEDENAVEKVAKACKEIGFFAITNHGVDPAVVDGLWSASAAFFDLPEAEKNLASSTNNEEYPYGYEQSENLQLAKTGVKTFDDLKETFSVGPSNPESGMPPRRIPSHPPAMKVHITSYYEAMENLALKILQIMARGLDLPPQWFEDKMDHHQCALRLLNYPNLTQAAYPGQLRAGAHTDYGIITILRSGGPGLQVKKDISGDDWVSVPDFARDVFIINLGDLMQRWTNGKIKDIIDCATMLQEYGSCVVVCSASGCYCVLIAS